MLGLPKPTPRGGPGRRYLGVREATSRRPEGAVPQGPPNAVAPAPARTGAGATNAWPSRKIDLLPALGRSVSGAT